MAKRMICKNHSTCMYGGSCSRSREHEENGKTETHRCHIPCHADKPNQCVCIEI